MTRLKEIYIKNVIPKLKEEFNFKNIHAVPSIKKIVINIGAGEALANKKLKEELVKDISLIVGQRPILTKSKKAISGFKIRQGQDIGLKITLHGGRMYDFLDKIINIALPRTRDFQGVLKSFDKNGNLSIGFKEYVVFPEASEETEKTYGIEVTICTSTKKDKEAQKLLEFLGMPFKQD